MEFDSLGRPRKSYNPFYASTPTGAIPTGTKYTEVVSYDALGRTTNVRLQDNTTAITTFNGTTVTVTDQAGKQRRQLADALGRIVRVDEPDANGNLDVSSVPAQPTNYEYDGNDNLVKVIQTGNGVTQERKFKYDSLSRLTHERQVEANATLDDNGVKGAIAPTKWTKVLKYTTKSLLVDGYDARGVNTHFIYDGLNRVASVSFTDGTPNVTYTYDQARTGFFNNGALTRVETAPGDAVLRPDTPSTATEFDYDKMGRVVKHRNSIGSQSYNLEYGYNLAGQLTSEKYPSGKVVTMNYDANGRLASIADASRTYANNFQYQTNGGMLNAFNLGNGTSQTFAYNDRLQMTQQNLSRSSEVLQKYDYGYGQIDAAGNLDLTKNNGQLARIESYIGSSKQWTQKFSYDSIGRLSEAKEYRGDTNALSYKQKFDFDRFGNLYRKNASNPTTGQENPLPFTPIEEGDINKSNNRLTTNTIYDDAGNVIQDNKFRDLNYSYDANGRMVKAIKTNVPDALSVYDALGNRVATKLNDVWQFVIYDAFGRLVAEYGGLQATDEGGVKYMLQDWQGSTRAIVGQAGFVSARMDYQAFGEEIQAGVGKRTTAQGFGSSSNLRQKYGLTERDEATGLDHTWFRKNENQAGRWTSPDPYNGSMSLDDPQSFNRYSYVENQPTNFVDPSGLNMAGPNTRYFSNPMGVAYYVDGILSDARTAWGLLESGAGFIDFHSFGGDIFVRDEYTGGEHSYRYGQFIHYFSDRLDLPQPIRDFIRDNQGQIDRCVNFVFGQKADGTASNVANRIARQTLKNAPALNTNYTQFQLQGYTGKAHTQGTLGFETGDKNGTVYIARDSYLGLNVRGFLPTDEVIRTFIHEWGNILSYRNANGNASAFGDPNGIGKSYKDPDTGARFEKCVFGSVPF